MDSLKQMINPVASSLLVMLFPVS